MAAGFRLPREARSPCVRNAAGPTSGRRHSQDGNQRVKTMQRNGPSFRQRIGRPTILAPALAIAIIAATLSASAEPSSPARAAQGRKISYHEVRRGLFALSKFPTAPIVMLGDSLTEAAPWDELTGCRQIANRGIGGDTTARVLSRLDEVLSMRPRAVFLMVGVNDISLRVPSETTAKNLGDTTASTAPRSTPSCITFCRSLQVTARSA